MFVMLDIKYPLHVVNENFEKFQKNVEKFQNIIMAKIVAASSKSHFFQVSVQNPFKLCGIFLPKASLFNKQ